MDEKNYRCENCGGIMEFDAKTQTLRCPNCDTTIQIDNNAADVEEHTFTASALNTYKVTEKTSSTMVCSGCGATIEVDKDSTAVKCPYCGSGYVLSDKQEEAIIPDGVIPFKIDKNKVQEIFGGWIKKRHLAPSELKALYQQGGITGRYIPFWTFDADTHASYTGMGGKHRTEHYKDKDGNTQTRTVTDWYHTSGRIDHFFDDLLIKATSNMKASLVRGVDSYDTHEVASYSPEYFSGYLSETYTVDLSTAHNQAVSEMNSQLHSMAANDIRRRYDEAKDIHLNVRYDNETFKHIMCPVYATSYSYKDKNYTVLVNGQNGEIKGEYPKSPAKIAAIILLIILAIAAFFGIKSMTGKKNNKVSYNDNQRIECMYDSDSNVQVAYDDILIEN